MTTSYSTDVQSRAYTVEEVQEEFFGHLAGISRYWSQQTEYIKDPSVDRLSGLMHSFHVTTTGCAGGFDASVDMRVRAPKKKSKANLDAGQNFFPAGRKNAVDINHGGMQYHSAEKHVDEPVQELGSSPRQWTEEELRAMFYNRIADFLQSWAAKENMSDLDKAVGMLRDIFVLCEGNDPKFEAKIDLVVVSQPEDKEYFIENDENYYQDETDLNAPERGLVQSWDEISQRILSA